MEYKLARQLKDAGWPQTRGDIGEENSAPFRNKDIVTVPTLSELIEACGTEYFKMGSGKGGEWYASKGYEHEVVGKGSTPEQAVAKLYLALHPKDV